MGSLSFLQGNLPNPGIEPRSPSLQADSLPSKPPGKSNYFNLFSTYLVLRFTSGSAGKESACNAGDLGSILGLGRPLGEGKRLPTPVFWPGEFHGQYSPWGHRVRHD